MSLTSMVVGTDSTAALKGGGGPVPEPLSTFVASVVTFIPSEVVTVYISAEAAIRGGVGTRTSTSSEQSSQKNSTNAGTQAPSSTVAASPSTNPQASTTATSTQPTAPEPYPSWAVNDAQVIFWICIILTVVWVVGLDFLALMTDKQKAKAANQTAPTYEFPLWKLVAGIIGFGVYALGVDTVWLNPAKSEPSHSIAITLLVIFVSPILVFANSLIAAIWPKQAVGS